MKKGTYISLLAGYAVTVEAGGKLWRDELLVGEETLRLAEWNGGDCGGVLITFI